MRRLASAVVASLALTGIVACENITDPNPGEPVDLSYAPCAGASGNPTWFAFQDGNGAWTRVNASGSGEFNFTISSGRGGIAMHSSEGLEIVYASTAEMQAYFPACTGSVRDVGGSVTGYVTADNINLFQGTSNTTVFGFQPAPASFTLSGVEPAATDLVAVRYRSTSNTTSYEEFPTNVFHRRAVTGTSAAVDFGSPTEAGVPLQRTVNLTNVVAGEAVLVASTLVPTNTLAILALYQADPAFVSGSVTAPFYGIAGSRLAAGESHMLLAEAFRDVGSTSEYRVVSEVYTDPADRSMTFGPALASVQIGGGTRPSATYTIQAQYDNLFQAVFEQGTGVNFRRIRVVATAAYLGEVSSVTLSAPDLSGVSGFLPTWLLVPGQGAFWGFMATDADLTALNGKAVSYRSGERESPFTP